MFDPDPDAWCDCGCDSGDDDYNCDFRVLSVSPDGFDAAEDELALSFGFSMHASTEFFHRVGVTASLKLVSLEIEFFAQISHVLMLHLRGQGSDGGFRLKDNKHLTPAHIVDCLKGEGFRGTVVCVLNCSPDPDSRGDDPATAWASASAWSPDLPFKWVLISSTSPPGTEAAVRHGDKVTKTVAALVRERVSYADLEAHIHRRWTTTMIHTKPPRVAMGGPYSGRFMQPVHS
jgi:hypothetical protein